MSNNYNQTLQSNNIDLQAILDTVNELPNAGGSNPILQDKTVTPTTSVQKVTADNNYDGLNEVTVNAMPTATQATPTISINSSTGLITATATQAAGYVAAGTKTATKQLAFQAAQTITPGTTNKTIAANTYLGGVQTIKGDANLVAGNIKSGTSIFGVTGTYAGSGGDTSMEDELVTRTLTSYTNNRVTSIGSRAFGSYNTLRTVNFPACISINTYAFYMCEALTTISFPKVQTIGNSAFDRCYALISANFPEATLIGNYAVGSCKALTTISFPKATTIGSYAFKECSNLTSVNFPEVTKINDAAFLGCRTLTTISFPKATTIGGEAFEYCYALTSVNFPEVTALGKEAFNGCSNLTSVNFPELTKISNSVFCGCSALSITSFPKVISIYSKAFVSCYELTTLSFPKVTTIASSAFYMCTALSRIYLLAPSVCTLQNSNAFTYIGSIFVPSSLVASYKTATNWTYFSNRIFGYEGEPEPVNI